MTGLPPLETTSDLVPEYFSLDRVDSSEFERSDRVLYVPVPRFSVKSTFSSSGQFVFFLDSTNVIFDRQIPGEEAPFGAQDYFWTKKWQKGENEADLDMRSGRTRRFSEVEKALVWLKD